MPIRPRETLRRDQAQIFLEHKLRQLRMQDTTQLPAADDRGVVVRWGRVEQIIETDPDHGPHLSVVPQVFTGIPPVAGDASGKSVICYPAPNRTLADYQVGEYVKILPTRGAFIADKSA